MKRIMFIAVILAVPALAIAAGDFAKPRTSDMTRTDYAAAIRDNDAELAKMLDGSTALNIPTGAKRWNASSNKFEKWNGSAWVDMATSNTYGINIGGNANTATSAASATSAGNATTAGGLAVHSGRNNEANKLVRTNANGYLDLGYLNTTADKVGTAATHYAYQSGNDDYLRWMTKSNVQADLGITKAYIDTLGITAASATSAASATNAGNADTLDGQHGSWYSNASNLNAGIVPLALLPATLTGKDADTVDGYHQTSFLTATDVSSKVVYGSVTIPGLNQATVNLGNTIRTAVCNCRNQFCNAVCDWSGSTLTLSNFGDSGAITLSYIAVIAR